MSTYELDGSTIIMTNYKAVLVRLDTLDEVWIPRSVCIDGDELAEDDTNIEVQAWWIEKEGII
jgi:hypothetical protein